jgi:hypothetical protein
MRPKIAMWADYGSPTQRRWRSRYRSAPSSTGPRILLVAVVAGVIGFIVSEWARGMSANSQGIAHSETAPESVRMTLESQPLSPTRPGWVAQLIGESSETAALSRFHQMQGKLPSLLGGYEPAILRTPIKPSAAPAWVRVRIEFDTRQAADALCSKLEAAGEIPQGEAPICVEGLARHRDRGNIEARAGQPAGDICDVDDRAEP